MSNRGHCGVCGESVIWADRPDGRSLPIDLIPDDEQRDIIVVHNERGRDDWRIQPDFRYRRFAVRHRCDEATRLAWEANREARIKERERQRYETETQRQRDWEEQRRLAAEYDRRRTAAVRTAIRKDCPTCGALKKEACLNMSPAMLKKDPRPRTKWPHIERMPQSWRDWLAIPADARPGADAPIPPEPEEDS